MTVFPGTTTTTISTANSGGVITPYSRLPYKYCVILNPTVPENESEFSCEHHQSLAGLLVEYEEVANNDENANAASHPERESGKRELPLPTTVDESINSGVGVTPRSAASPRKGFGKKGVRKSGNKSTSSRWDQTLIGPFCWWRSCLDDEGGCRGTAHVSAGGKHVCEVHGEQKAFLDRRALTLRGKPGSGSSNSTGFNSKSEANRYLLPKGPPSSEARKNGKRIGLVQADLRALLHASSLLQVVCDNAV